MKILLYISLFSLFTACSQQHKKTGVTDFKYSSYLWHLNQDSHKYEFYLANYFHVNSNGEFKLIKHTTFLDTPQYFSGVVNDFTRQSIDSILLENNFFPQIKTTVLPDTPLLIYDGFTYLLDYETIGKARNKIQYINSSARTPKNILYLTSLLDNLISKTQLNRSDSFPVDSYIDTLKKLSSYNLPPEPQSPTPNNKSLRFISPKTKQ